MNFHLMLICDECNENVCHTYCDPALRTNRIPEDDWYCMECRFTDICYNLSKREG